MILYSGPVSMFGAKAEIALREKGIPFELVLVPFSLAGGYEPKHAEVARINPKAQVPVLVDGQVEIYDSTQIFEYLEDKVPSPHLWPTEVEERARARRLELEADEIFFAEALKLRQVRQATRPASEVPEIWSALRRIQQRIDAELAGRDYICGSFSYADIALFTAQLWAAILGAPVPPDCARLKDYWHRMWQRGSVAAVGGRILDYLAVHEIKVAGLPMA